MTSEHSKGKILIVEDDRAFRHAVSEMLRDSGFTVTEEGDGLAALELLERQDFDLLLLDIGLPGMSGLDLLARINEEDRKPRVVIITVDRTPDTVLQTIRAQAYQYVAKPVTPAAIVEVVEDVLRAPSPLPIEVVSAKPDWVELDVSCHLQSAERIQSFLANLKADLPDEIRESVGQAFRELLLNAIEWGGGLDPNRKVRIAYLRTKKMLMYRIADPGPGFRPAAITHSAEANPDGAPFEHMADRERKGIRPGGFGLLMTRTLVDELIFNEAHNEVVFVKYLD